MMKRLTPQLRWFLAQLRPLLQAHLLSVLLIVLASLTFLLDPLILKWLIDIVLPKRDARLLLGKAEASIEELWEVVEVAGLTALIHSLPRGWNSQIGPRGMFLSGGERQRLSRARAVLQKPSVFLLDESTSALDVPSERQVYINLTQHFAEQTILFVSHRVSALPWTDRMVVLNHGVIEEEGTHDQLIQIGHFYPNLFKWAPSLDESAPFYSTVQQKKFPPSYGGRH